MNAKEKNITVHIPPKAVRLQEAYLWLNTNGKVENKDAFAVAIGKSPSHMSSVMNGNRELTEAIAKVIEKKYKISMPWLLLGVGEMLKTKAKPTDNAAIMKLLLAMAEDISTIKNALKTTNPPHPKTRK